MEETIEKIKVNQKTVRFNKAKWYAPGTVAIIGGVGGIGSWLAFFLGRQEMELHIYDMDTIEESNIGGQLYHLDDIKDLKTKATASRIALYSDNKNIHLYEKYVKESLRDQYMFSCFDNLDARKVMFENWLKVKDENKIFIDGRMSMTTFDVFFVTPDRIMKYQEDLYSDIKIEPLSCNLKATSHCGAMCAGMMLSGFNNYMANVAYNDEIHDLPFKISTKLDVFEFEIIK